MLLRWILALALLQVLVACNETAADESEVVSASNVIERDMGLIAQSGSSALIEQYGLFSPGSGAILDFVTEIDQVGNPTWDARLSVSYHGGESEEYPSGWWLDTTDNFEACTFQVGSDWYAAANGLTVEQLRALVMSLVDASDDNEYGKAPQWNSESLPMFMTRVSLKDQSFSVHSTSDLRDSELTSPFSLQFERHRVQSN